MPSLTTKNYGEYASPTVKVYGDVKTLTASGTGTSSENGTTPVCNPPNNTKKPC